ncbi:hypothetical protein [Streptomyces sp. NPDC018352]|uniref:hypothetical protein n=1 Tax=Streptomyces sp. NPDC018352 TaxID=3157194 RepID=UPI0033E74195
MLSTLCHVRETEITDSLARAEKKVEGEFSKEMKRVRGKEGMGPGCRGPERRAGASRAPDR